MKNVLCSHFLNAVVVTALLLATGCVSSKEQGGADAENNQIESEAIATKVTAEPVKPVQQTGEKGLQQIEEQAKPLQKTEKSVLLGAHKDLLKLFVKLEGKNSDENALASDILRRIQGALSSNDAKVVTAGNCDVRVVIRPKLTTVDQDGGYYRMNCAVDVEMTSADGRRVFGTNTIEVAAPRRVLGKDAAISGLAEPAANKTSDWCRSELKKVTDAEVGATILSIQLPTVPNGEKRNAVTDAANIKTIGDEIAKLPSLVTYELVGQDSQDGTCQYRVVYFISKYPNGIANEVSVLLSKVKQK